ncbi:UNVERIFIED_CONTAM: Pumilio23 [Sesamum radiatum]|uniref:Pumilio23 n=1 Tax=Sesamum radiatum TaxID=300843 RepID=A0AAW2WLZ8_SESRA
MHGIGLCFGDIGMVSIGLKALQLRKHKSRNLSEDGLMADEGTSSIGKVRKHRRMGRKGSKKNAGFHGGASTENQSGGGVPKKFAKDKTSSVHQASYIRKQVDPETATYFSEISNVIEGAEIDLEERSIICGNALEEARGKEVELATDYIISHTMQTLLEGCSVEHLCAFLRGCAKDFCRISMDRSGSHVAETALKSLARHLEDDESHTLIEETLSTLCQTALKLLAGKEEELFRLVPVLLGCHADNALDGDFIEVPAVKKILRLVEENAYSHLMEVILAVAPDTLYNEIFTKVFKNSLFRMSSHPSANFVVQALISHARNQEHIKLIYEELGSRFKSLVELGRCGVAAALVAASQRLEIYEQKFCKALADAVCLTNEPSACIVPRILFLDNYFSAVDKANWNWPSGVRMHVLGSLMLQSIFRFPSEFVEAYITSITSLEENQVLEASKDPAGVRVIEAFLTSNASAKQKRNFAKRPDHWRSRQTSKESAYKEFYAAFGPMDTKSSRSENFLSDTHHKSMEKLKGMRKEIDASLSSGYSSKSGTPFLAHQGSARPKKKGNKQVPEGREFPRDGGDDSFQSKSKRHKVDKTSISSKNDNDGETLHGDKSSNIKNENKRRRKDGLSKSLDKKLKAGI